MVIVLSWVHNSGSSRASDFKSAKHVAWLIWNDQHDYSPELCDTILLPILLLIASIKKCEKLGNERFNIRAHTPLINLLLTEREGRTGEYLTEVVTVWTERSEVRTKTTEGQYSTVRLEQARLVSCLLYGILFLIAKCTSGGLHLKMFVFSINLRNFGKISIFLASSTSFIVKNDNIQTFFSPIWLQILNLPASLQNKNTKSWPRKNQSEHRDLPKTGFAI